MAELELFRRYPKTRDLPHVSLANLPTPVESLDRLGEELGIKGLWVKRDDKTATLYGGNKVRKLEFILADAVEQGHKRVWTVGAVGSHHVLATSLYARKLGLEPHALHFPQPLTEHVREVLRALSTTEPQLELIGSKHALPGAMIKSRVKEWLSRAENPYYIPGGGSSPRGVLGYVNGALELARQIDNGDLPLPDAIFVAAGTCGTLSGLALGSRMAELPCPIIGVRVVDKVLANPLVAASLANRAGKILADCGVEVPHIGPTDITIIDNQIGPGYGEATAQGTRALERAQKLGGLELDPTYTAKAFAGLLDFIEQSQKPLTNLLYWHTLSSADLSPLIEEADVMHGLPEAYREFL